MATTKRQIEREVALVRLRAAEVRDEVEHLEDNSAEQRLEATERALAQLLEVIDELSAGLTVSQTAQRLEVSAPTVTKWLKEGLLEAIPERRPVEVTPGSVVEVERILQRVRDTYPTRQWTKALAAYLHDQDLQNQDWFREGAEQYRRGEYVER